MDGAGDILDVQDAFAPLGDRTNDVELIVDLMERSLVLPQHIALDLARHQQHRRGAGIGGAQRRRGILDPWSWHHQPHPRFSSHPSIAIRHIGGGLFVAHGDQFHVGLPIKGIVDPHDLHTWEAKHTFDAFPLQCLDDCLPTRHLRHRSSFAAV